MCAQYEPTAREPAFDMESKTARLTLLIDPNKKAAFERLCSAQDRTASQVVRQLIRDYLVEHGVHYAASGTGEPDDEPVASSGAVSQPARKVKLAPKSGSGRRHS